MEAERLPEIVRAQRLQRQEARGQGDARAGSWRYTLARHGARLLVRYRWAHVPGWHASTTCGSAPRRSG